MAKNLISNEERLELIELYKKDKLNAPPSNILDSTLIAQYGTDEQKNRVQAASAEPTPKAPKAKTTESTEPAAGAGEGFVAGTAEKPENLAPVEPAPAAPTATKDSDYVEAFNEYVNLFLKMPKDSATLEELQAANKVKQEQNDVAEKAKHLKANQPKAERRAEGMVTIVNDVTGEPLEVNRFTWEKFISKDKTHSLQVEKPAELKNK